MKLQKTRAKIREKRKELKLAIEKHIEEVRHLSTLITALYVWIIFLGYEVFVRTYDLYRTVPQVDIMGHFLAGIALAASFFWFTSRYKIKHFVATIFFGTILVSLVWEAVEAIQEVFIFNPPYLIDIFFYDGVFDVVMAGIGAITFLMLKSFTEES